jgi:lipoic acid synthetase
MGLKHAVITSVTRDDLPDGGAAHWAAVVRAVRLECPDTTIEVLIPDFGGDKRLVDVVLEARPDITGHNIETVSRLTPDVRSKARYGVSLEVLRHISAVAVAKSGLMVGLGETPDEVLGALDDLRAAGVSVVTLGQYLRPTMAHLPVAEYVTPEMFEFYRQEALARGFSHVASGPLVRSSYMAEKALDSLTRTAV